MNIRYGTKKYNKTFKEIGYFNNDYIRLPRNIKPYVNHRTFKVVIEYMYLIIDIKMII